MAGTKAGGLKAARTNKLTYGYVGDNNKNIFINSWGELRVGWFMMLSITILILILAAILIPVTHFAWNTGEDIYTGYIYSTETFFDRTNVHIRFSETAGEDTQPSFCVAEEDKEFVQSLAGSGKKVRVTVPAGIVWKFFTSCQIPAHIEVADE